MAPSSDDHHERYLPTRWRVVGAAQIAERAAVYAIERLEPGQVSDTHNGVQCTMDLQRAAAPQWSACSTLGPTTSAKRGRIVRGCSHDAPVERTASRFSGLRFEMLANPGKDWVGDLACRTR